MTAEARECAEEGERERVRSMLRAEEAARRATQARAEEEHRERKGAALAIEAAKVVGRIESSQVSTAPGAASGAETPSH